MNQFIAKMAALLGAAASLTPGAIPVVRSIEIDSKPESACIKHVNYSWTELMTMRGFTTECSSDQQQTQFYAQQNADLTVICLEDSARALKWEEEVPCWGGPPPEDFEESRCISCILMYFKGLNSYFYLHK